MDPRGVPSCAAADPTGSAFTTVATVVATGAGLGAGLSVAMVSLAQRAQREELAVVDDVARLASSDERLRP